MHQIIMTRKRQFKVPSFIALLFIVVCLRKIFIGYTSTSLCLDQLRSYNTVGILYFYHKQCNQAGKSLYRYTVFSIAQQRSQRRV